MSKYYQFNRETGDLVEVYDSLQRAQAPAIHLDEIPPTEHPATGKIFTSRAKFDAETIAAGCVPVHGNDKPVKRWETNAQREEREYRQFEDNFERAWYDLEYKRVPQFRTNPEALKLWKAIHGDGDS
ncbi:hypothetical protein UFOVP313_44 [uncultured Caudovirales phage]|uniref:Uncharacterized protein n=1 Tax=uncultured Caudovirales phage TaxID=2100421 RepID=A0A6J5LRN9_9CAUD|nr:hypothetical protein UFOVP313_44 [uncultured Caudovirales phage]